MSMLITRPEFFFTSQSKLTESGDMEVQNIKIAQNATA